jgi:hypothetical protein
VDRNRLNNKIENLRVTTHKRNAFNVTKTKSSTTSRYVGVDLYDSQYQARLLGKHLGVYNNKHVAGWVVNEAGLLLYPDIPPRNSISQPEGWVFDKEKMRGVQIATCRKRKLSDVITI